MQEPFVFYQDGSTLKELVKTQAELIAMQRKRIEDAENENKRLREEKQRVEGENKALKEVISNRKGT